MSGTIAAPETPVCWIDQYGLHAPTYQDVYNYLIAQYQSIYGADVYLGNDSQDGQFIALLALAISDTNGMAAAVYASFSPTTAFGIGLATVVKINGLTKLIATNSTVDLTLVGQAGTPIINGIVRDTNKNNWLLPASVTIPTSGQIIVTAISATQGAVSAAAGTVNTIATPTRGWQSAINVLAAEAGDPVEQDASLRQRQAASTSLPSLTVVDGIAGAIASITGVSQYTYYENDESTTDSNGVPAHSISFVVNGGDAGQIAAAIALKKTPGTGTYGTTSESVTDAQGVTKTISFFRPTLVPITVALTIEALTGFTASTGTAIIAAIAAFITALPIGQDVLLGKLFSPANLVGVAGVDPTLTNTYNLDVSSFLISRSGPPAAPDVPIAFNEDASCTAANISLTVTT